MKGYDEYNTILLPPRNPGDRLPHELLDYFEGNYLTIMPVLGISCMLVIAMKHESFHTGKLFSVTSCNFIDKLV